MNTLENTVSMMKALPETDLVKIQDFTKKLFQKCEFEAADEAVGKFLKSMSREDFMRDIEVAERDMKETVKRLSCMAGSLKLCDDPRLRDLGYRTIHLKCHKYFMLYKIVSMLYILFFQCLAYRNYQWY